MLEIFPAIDLQNGQAVRLYKGNMQNATTYGDPHKFIRYFEEIGARWVHIVDLDGALNGKRENLATIESIRKNTTLKIQLGGGIRNEASIKAYLELGIDRIILGSVAANNPNFAKQMAQKYPIAIGIDARDGLVATNGWVESSKMEAISFAKTFSASSVEAIICTDITRDGALKGVNIDFSVTIGKASGCCVIASGGVASIQDLILLNEAFHEHNIQGGVIIGKAFYENKINLQEAFSSIVDYNHKYKK